MTTITITLPDDLAKQAEEKGLLSQTAIESYVRDRLQETDAAVEAEQAHDDDIGVDLVREGLVNPVTFKKGTIVGDIIGPFHDVWGEAK